MQSHFQSILAITEETYEDAGNAHPKQYCSERTSAGGAGARNLVCEWVIKKRCFR